MTDEFHGCVYEFETSLIRLLKLDKIKHITRLELLVVGDVGRTFPKIKITRHDLNEDGSLKHNEVDFLFVEEEYEFTYTDLIRVRPELPEDEVD